MLLGLAIRFARPIYLLALVLFFAFTIIPYFRLSKRYRKTRNRLTSMALHAMVSLLVVSLLAGITFVRSSSNSSNEIILVVDVSNTENQSANDRDDFVQVIINQSKFDNYKVGVVTFGYNQVEAVSLTRDYKNIYKKYKEATLPDTSATNIADALLFAKKLLSVDNNGKLVLITDGKETDENARSVIRSIVASGTIVDCAYIPSSYEGNDDLQILNVNMPEYHVNKNEECTITIDVFSNYDAADVTFKLLDNGTPSADGEVIANINEGTQSISFNHMFDSEGLHEITFEVVNNEDSIVQNNDYTTYYNLQVFNKILIIEQEEGSSELIKTMMTADDSYKVDVLNVTRDDLPTEVLKLCEYDEIIMNNIANSDLPEEFVPILNDYVYNYGGGLFTTGGTDNSGDAHAYNRNDLVGTMYQQMLPVQAINYTPPVGVMFIIDRSGSMSVASSDGNTVLEVARAGLRACLQSLTERDYVGIMSLDNVYDTILDLTPRTQEAKILSAIETINEANGGTVFPGAIDRAGQALRALKTVDKKHIVIITDGQVPTGEVEEYESYCKNYYETDGITISVVGVRLDIPGNANELMNSSLDNIDLGSYYKKMLRITKITNGRLHAFSNDIDASKLIHDMREDLNAPDIKELIVEPFNPIVVNSTSSIFKGVSILNDDEHSNTLPMELGGFFGTKVRASADLLLTGDYNVPVYAQWKYGNGMVGSFMCDVSGDWSNELMSDENGKTLLFNIINNLTPTENIRPNDIKLVLYENNYSNTVSVYTNLNEGESIKGEIVYKNGTTEKTVSLNNESNSDNIYCVSPLNVDNNYSRTKFVIKSPGAYTLVFKKIDKNGNVIGENSIIKSFAYSEEYNYLDDDSIDYKEKLTKLSMMGNGKLVEDLDDPHEIFDSFDTVVYNEFDPRFLFAILAIILFLADVAVRKFKFKWPHEIIHDLRNRKWAKK